VAKLYWAEHAAQKARKKAETKVWKKAERRRVMKEEKKKKRILEYLQQLLDKVLEENTILLKSTERSQIVGPKCKKVPLENDANHLL